MQKHKKISFNIMILNFIALLILAYFIYHSLAGNRGFLKMSSLNKEIEQKKVLLSGYKAEKEYLENRANLLYDKSINKDILDEIARDYFGLIGEGEICINNYKKQTFTTKQQ